MKIFIASDHAGFNLKKELIGHLRELNYDVEDKGALTLDENDDYPDFISLVAEEVAKNPIEHRGIVLGGSGQGEAIVANRFPGVYAALYYGSNIDIVKYSREHNNANILSLGARFLSEEEALDAVKLWLETDFSNDPRHVRRIGKIDQLLK
ncbi:MAG: RpiB/LacA/LacB family sugar-phosphate isomerase [Candidatus Paceibacterota bacterium]